MKKTLAFFTTAALVFLPFAPLAFASNSYTSNAGDVDMNTTTSSRFFIDRLGSCVSSGCQAFWTSLTPGQSFTITGSTGNDGTYIFVSAGNFTNTGVTPGTSGQVNISGNYPVQSNVQGAVTFTAISNNPPALTGFVFLSASSSAASVGLLSGDVSVSLDSAIYLTLIAIAVPLAFYVIQQLLEWFNNPKYKKRR